MAHIIAYTLDGSRQSQRFPAGAREEVIRDRITELAQAGATFIERAVDQTKLPWERF